MSTQLRFALLARVSTETQERDGVSLEVQKKTLLQCIKVLGGECIKEYTGQESATAGEGKERPILDELMFDMTNGLFNALIVYDQSRLTRDPVRSKIIQAELRKHKIRFFTQTTEHDLFSLESNLFMGLMSEINAFTVAIQQRKSIESKLALARKGWLVQGTPPFGRFIENQDKSKEAVWSIDPEKREFAQRVFDLYINQGLYVEQIESLLSVNISTLFRIIKDRGEIVQKFKNTGETITTKVPDLFTSEQKKQLKIRLKGNKSRNAKKHDYLLSGLVRCPICGLNFHGITMNGYLLYYRHSQLRKTEHCIKMTRGDKLERAVMFSIARIISNQELLVQSIQQSNSNSKIKKDKIEIEQRLLESKKEKLQQNKTRIINLLIEGTYTREDMAKPIAENKKKLEDIEKQLVANEFLMKSLNFEIPMEIISKIQYVYDSLKDQNGVDINQWDLGIKLRLLNWFFGINPNNGVFLRKDYFSEDDNDKAISFALTTNLGTLSTGIIDGTRLVFDTTGSATFATSLNAATICDFSNIINDLQQVEVINPNYVGKDGWGFHDHHVHPRAPHPIHSPLDRVPRVCGGAAPSTDQSLH